MNLQFGENEKLTGPFTKGKIVEQRFKAKDKLLKSISISIGTYLRKNIGNEIIVKIIDSKKKILKSIKVNCRIFCNNKFNEIIINCPIIKNRKYALVIESISGDKFHSITLKYGRKKQNELFFINDSIMESYELSCILNFSNKTIKIKNISKIEPKNYTY